MTIERARILAVCVILLLVFAASAQGFESARVKSVIDGATVLLTSGEVVGYAGVKIPETEPETAERAAAFNESLVSGAEVRLEYDVEKRDFAGRLLAYVYVGRLFVNKELVELGFAEVDTETANIRYRKLLFRAQRQAFERRRGLWAERFGEEGAELVKAPEMPGAGAVDAAAAKGVPVSLPDEERPLAAVDVAYRFFIGDVFTYDATLTRRISSSTGQTQVEDAVDLSVELLWTVEDVDAKGGATITQSITTIEASAMSERISQEEVERMGQLAGRSVTAVLDSKGFIAEVRGMEELLDDAPPSFHSLLLDLFSNHTPLPGRQVKLGDFWWIQRALAFYGREGQMSLGMDAKSMVVDFAQVAQYRCAEISMEGTLGAQGGEEEGLESPVAATGKISNTYHVAYDDGLLARSEGEVEVLFASSAAQGAAGEVVIKDRRELALREVVRGENYLARKAAPTKADLTVYVGRDVVNLRGEATTKSPVLARLELGQELDILARKGDWYKVKYTYPVWGWIRSDLVEGEPSEAMLLQIPEEGEEWQEPGVQVAERVASPDVREKVIFYAEVEEALREREMAAAVAEAPEGMVYVSAGSFLMGSDVGEANASPVHEVFVEGFYIDRLEITNKEFQEFRQDFVFPQGEESHPVTGISWEDANVYCGWAGKRLPTEDEWEKAARGTEAFIYPWGNDFEAGRANTQEAEKGGTAPVGQYPGGASPYGAYGLGGNAAEWTASWYKAYPGNTSPDPDYGQTFKVLRGGSWFTPKEQATTFFRLHDNPGSARAYYGFRCAVSPQQAATLVQKEEVAQATPEAEKVVGPEAEPAVEYVPEGIVERLKFEVMKVVARILALIGR